MLYLELFDPLYDERPQLYIMEKIFDAPGYFLHQPFDIKSFIYKSMFFLKYVNNVIVHTVYPVQ